MTTLARKTLLVLLTFGPALLAPLSAPANEMRFPEKAEKGVPAVVFTLPDKWSVHHGAGSVILVSADGNVSLAIWLGAKPGAPDDMANEYFKKNPKLAPYQRKEPFEISGCRGFTYFSAPTNAAGGEKVELSCVRVKDKYAAETTLILVSESKKDDVTAARTLRNSLKLATK